jgi:Protein of unknown function (DUF3592)
MPFPQNLAALMLANRTRVIRWMFLPQLLVALLFLWFTYLTGHSRAPLVLHGAQTQGRVVSFRAVRRSDRSGANARLSDTDYTSLPTVEFSAAGRIVRFEDWAAPSDPSVGSSVPVLYDAGNPSVAMIDRGALNWLPWAPCAAIGLLLALVALKGLFVFLFSSLRSPAAVST